MYCIILTFNGIYNYWYYGTGRIAMNDFSADFCIAFYLVLCISVFRYLYLQISKNSVQLHLSFFLFNLIHQLQEIFLFQTTETNELAKQEFSDRATTLTWKKYFLSEGSSSSECTNSTKLTSDSSTWLMVTCYETHFTLLAG